MKVLTYVTRFRGHAVAGLEAHIFDEIIRVASHLKRVIVITTEAADHYGKPANIELRKAPVIPIPKLHGATKIISYALTTLLTIRKVDVIYVRTFGLPELISALIAKKVAKIPLILLIGGVWLLIKTKGLKGVFYRAVFNAVAESADAVILYSWAMLPSVVKHLYAVRREKVKIVRNAIDAQRFNPNINCEGLRQAIQLQQGEKVVLYVGRIDPLKGVEEIIEAAPIVLKEVNAKFLLVGEGTPRTIKEVRRRLASLKVEQNFKLIGPIPNREMPKYYCLADVFILPSRGGEGIPRSILEAMACAKPVIATSVGGIAEAVKNGENGFLIPVKDPKALAQKLITLLKNDALRREMGKRGRELVEKEFNWEVTVLKLVDILKSVK
ncbi:MAG: glycosyltransferase family 4 protein [Candidatus Nezhaarchaeales archaeon]